MTVKRWVVAVLLLCGLSACTSISDMLSEEKKAHEARKAVFDKAVAGLVGDYRVVDGEGFDNGFGIASTYVKVKATVEGGQLKLVMSDRRDSTWKLNGQQCRGQIGNDYQEQAVTCNATVFYLDGLSQEFTLFKAGRDRVMTVFATESKGLPFPVKKGDYVLHVTLKGGGRQTCFRLAKT